MPTDGEGGIVGDPFADHLHVCINIQVHSNRPTSNAEHIQKENLV